MLLKTYCRRSATPVLILSFWPGLSEMFACSCQESNALKLGIVDTTAHPGPLNLCLESAYGSLVPWVIADLTEIVKYCDARSAMTISLRQCPCNEPIPEIPSSACMKCASEARYQGG